MKARIYDYRTDPLVIVVALLMLCGCKAKKEAPPAKTPPVVEVVTVEQKDVPIYKEWVGSLVADVTASISAQVSGYLTNRAYIEGAIVTNGQLLFQIDSAPYEAAVAKAKAQLEQARARKGKTALDVQRYRPLAETDAISKQELDNAVQADLAAAAEIDSATASLKEAQLNLGFTTIRSPINGMAGLAKAQIGDLVGANTGPLTSVAKIDPIRANFSVSEQTIYEAMEQRAGGGGSARETIELQLLLASGKAYPEQGRIRFSDNKVDVKTGTVEVVGEFPNSRGTLLPGMFAHVRAMIGVRTNALLVPQRAVTEMQGRYLIALVGAENKIAIQPITVGELVNSKWIIQSRNLKAGDQVVAEGTQKVREGMVVTPKPFTPPAPDKPGAENQGEPVKKPNHG